MIISNDLEDAAEKAVAVAEIYSQATKVPRACVMIASAVMGSGLVAAVAVAALAACSCVCGFVGSCGGMEAGGFGIHR